MTSPFSPPVSTFLFTLRFLFRNPGAILRRIAIPTVLGVNILYFLIAAYLHQVDTYLGNPSGGNASQILGVAALGVLMMLFLHAQLVSAVAGLLLEGRRESFLGIYSHEWRLYVASLQLVLIVCAYGCVIWAADTLGAWLVISAATDLAVKMTLMALLFWILARAWFFLLPLCVSTREDEMLLRSWQASRGQFSKIAGLLLLITLVVGVCHFILQIFLGFWAVVPPLPRTVTISAALDVYRPLLLPSVLLMSGTYLPAAILTSMARIRFFQELTGAAGPRHEG